MKKIWLVSAALAAALASGSAFAADLPPAPQCLCAGAVRPPPRFSWTGCYLGIDGGGILGAKPAYICGIVTGKRWACHHRRIQSRGERRRVRRRRSAAIIKSATWWSASRTIFRGLTPAGVRNDIAPFNLAAGKHDRSGDLARYAAWARRASRGSVSISMAPAARRLANEGVNVCAPGWLHQRLADQNRVDCRRRRRVGGLDGACRAHLTFKVEYLHADLGTGRFVNPPFMFPTGRERSSPAT